MVGACRYSPGSEDLGLGHIPVQVLVSVSAPVLAAVSGFRDRRTGTDTEEEPEAATEVTSESEPEAEAETVLCVEKITLLAEGLQKAMDISIASPHET